MKKSFLIAATLLMTTFFVFQPLVNIASAEDTDATYSGPDTFRNFLGHTEYGEITNADAGITSMIVIVLRTLFSLLGIIFLILTLYAGFMWMTAGGNEEQLTKAKNIIKTSIIGLAIVLSAYAITYFIVSWFGSGLYETGVGGNGTPIF